MDNVLQADSAEYQANPYSDLNARQAWLCFAPLRAVTIRGKVLSRILRETSYRDRSYVDQIPYVRRSP